MGQKLSAECDSDALPAVCPKTEHYILDTASSVELIVMDELGDLERDARRFQTTVFNVLESETPVLGVIKLSAGGWVEQIPEGDTGHRKHRKPGRTAGAPAPAVRPGFPNLR